jgi:hypothetical protein
MQMLDLDTQNEIEGRLSHACRLLKAVVQMLENLDIDRDDAEPIKSVVIAAWEKIEEAGERLEPTKPKAAA